MDRTQDQLDCDWLVNYNNGCGAGFTEDNSYGPGFNSAGGGWYAIERTDEGIKIWFWSARNGNPPRDVYRGSPIVDPSDWVSHHGGRMITMCGLLMSVFGILRLAGHTVCVLPEYAV